MAGRRKTRWRGRYTNKADFLLRMERLINRQVENYEKDPEQFRHFLPSKLHLAETERSPSALISQTLIYAECLIAIGRIPTPEYMWHLMAIEPEDAPRSEERRVGKECRL